MVTVDNDGARQAVLRSMDEIFNVRRATRKISHPSHSLYKSFKSVPVFFLRKTPPSRWGIQESSQGSCPGHIKCAVVV